MKRVAWGLVAFVVLLGGALIAMVRFESPPAVPGQSGEVAASSSQQRASEKTPRATRISLPAATVAGADTVALDTLDAPAMRVPVLGIDRASLQSNWGDPRADGARAHTGLDILAERGTPAVAAVDGTIEKLFFSEGGGGITLYLRSLDRRWIFYYAHLGGYAPGVAEGRRVAAGTVLGYVGDTGNAAPGNHHLHFGVSRMAPGERWHQGTPIDPYPLLARGQGGR